MNAERLLKHYETIADAPDAIARLRRFILDLAVRGKLVPQAPNDEPASELLKRIAKEKARLVAEGGFNSLEPIDCEGATTEPFELPSTWAWCLLDDIAGIARGGSPRPIKSYLTRDANGIPWIKIGDSTRGSIYINGTEERIKPEGLSRSRLVVPGDLLLSNSMSFGYPYITNISGCIHDGWLVIRTPENQISKLYIHSMFLSEYAKRAFSQAAAGAVVQNLNADKVRRLLVPLPPLAEQHRIVAKVDELMALCDRLEAARASREAMRDRLAAASLARLNAPDPETFQADARFALAAMPASTTRPDQIKQFRQTILNLAVRGKLVPQDASDEPAAELLKRIAVERAELVKKKEIRREDPLDPIQSAEMPFDVAAGWVWSRIGEAVLFTQYGTSQKSTPSENGVPVLTMGNVQDGLVIWSNEKRIPETSEDLPALYLRKFDLLYNRTNSAELVGKTGIYLGDDGVRTFASYLIRLRPSLPSSNPRFLNMAMNTPEFRETQIIPLIKKQTGQANVNGTALKSMLIPLPPLAEQHRIVAKVDALMALCDRLEASLTASAATRRRLLDALLAEALTPVADRELEAAE